MYDYLELRKNLGGPPLNFSFTPDNRTISVTSPEDGAPVSYTMYRLDSNDTIEAIADADDTLVFESAEADDPPQNTTYSNIALVEGSYIVEKGVFSPSERVKTIALAEGPVIEKSVRVFIGNPGE